MKMRIAGIEFSPSPVCELLYGKEEQGELLRKIGERRWFIKGYFERISDEEAQTLLKTLEEPFSFFHPLVGEKEGELESYRLRYEGEERLNYEIIINERREEF